MKDFVCKWKAMINPTDPTVIMTVHLSLADAADLARTDPVGQLYFDMVKLEWPHSAELSSSSGN